MAVALSKSMYCSGLQCPKMLWLKKHRPEQFDETVMNRAVLATGNEVGDLAMGMFGTYTEVPFGDLTLMTERTAQLMQTGEAVIAEASFAYHTLFCSVDILRNLGEEAVEVYEVKSSTSVKDIYLDDLSFQCYVLSHLGYTVERACLVHINSQYTREVALDLRQLFHTEDVTAAVIDRCTQVEDVIGRIEACMQQEEEPTVEIGKQCFAPYSCGFWGYCTRALPKPNVFDVSGIRSDSKLKHYSKGLITFADLASEGILSANQRMQVEHELYSKEPYIEADRIRAFLDGLHYPLYFLDFESFQPAIPLYDHSHPFEQIVFQYSLHCIEEEGGVLQHKEFLAYPGADPRPELARQLCRDIPENACVLAYNMAFEKARIRTLAELYPDLSAHLKCIHDNMQDLMVPFQKKHYYARTMKGSFSIKYVLPALFPDDPALDYHNLDGIHNGAEASAAFKRMSAMAADELETYRKQLLAYCGLDTLAMVKIWEKLKEVSAPLQESR